MSQPDRQDQGQSKVSGVGQQVKQATDKLKTQWLNLSGRNKIIAVCVGVLCLFLLWRLVGGGGSSYTPDTLRSLVQKDLNGTKKQLEETWITVTGKVDKAAYLPDGAFLVAKNTSVIALSSDSDKFTVEGYFEGPKSGGVETNSLSRGDTVTIKGKVDIVADKVIGIKQCEIVSTRRK